MLPVFVAASTIDAAPACAVHAAPAEAPRLEGETGARAEFEAMLDEVDAAQLELQTGAAGWRIVHRQADALTLKQAPR